MTESGVFCELICRACLGSGRLYSIHECQLADYYNELIGTKVLPDDGLPQHLCAICSTMLLKHAEFKNRCLKAQKILYGLKKRQDVITSNFEDLNLNKRYSQSPIKTTEYPQTDPDIIVYHREEPDILQTDIKVIKNEIDVFTEEFSMKADDNSSDSYQFCADEVKVDQDAKFNEMIKSKVNNSKKTKVKKAKVKSENDSKNPELEKEVKKKFKRAPKVNKIKGKYFETKENMTNFESMYEVEIVVLTKEQQLNDVLDRKTSENYLCSPYKCQYCFKGFIDEAILEKHFKSQHDPSRGDVTCEFCQFRYKDKRGLNQHLKSHRLKFVCRQCKYVSRTTYNAKEHYKMHRGHMHECKDCGKSYEKLSTYLTHMRVHHPAELVWCDLCGEPFIGEFGLNGHKKRAHRDVQFPAQCACGARFTSAGALQTHAGARACGQAACAHCGRGFPAGPLLRDHLLQHHRPEAKYYSCSKCSKRFSSEALYGAHYRRMHAGGTRRAAARWVCEVCGKALPNRCRLLYHQRVHTGERPYQCPQCPKSFTMSKLLASHSRVHTNERPYACRFCPKTFKGPSALRGHQCMHTGGKIKNAKSRPAI